MQLIDITTSHLGAEERDAEVPALLVNHTAHKKNMQLHGLEINLQKTKLLYCLTTTCLLLAQTAQNVSRCLRRRATCRKRSFHRSGIERQTRLIDCHVSIFSVRRQISNDSLKQDWRRTLIWSRRVSPSREISLQVFNACLVPR